MGAEKQQSTSQGAQQQSFAPRPCKRLIRPWQHGMVVLQQSTDSVEYKVSLMVSKKIA